VLPAQSEPVHDPRAEVLDQHVGPDREAAGDVEVGRIGQVERDTPLTAVVEGVGRLVRPRRAGPVDVDDVGALVGEHHGDERPGHVMTEVDDPDALEWSHRAFRGDPCLHVPRQLQASVNADRPNRQCPEKSWCAHWPDAAEAMFTRMRPGQRSHRSIRCGRRREDDKNGANR
jgi:hypothetical protein